MRGGLAAPILVVSIMDRIGEVEMLGWALMFLIVAIIAGVLGFGGIAGASAGIAKLIFFVFLILSPALRLCP